MSRRLGFWMLALAAGAAALVVLPAEQIPDDLEIFRWVLVGFCALSFLLVTFAAALVALNPGRRMSQMLQRRDFDRAAKFGRRHSRDVRVRLQLSFALYAKGEVDAAREEMRQVDPSELSGRFRELYDSLRQRLSSA